MFKIKDSADPRIKKLFEFMRIYPRLVRVWGSVFRLEITMREHLILPNFDPLLPMEDQPISHLKEDEKIFVIMAVEKYRRALVRS